VSPSSKSRVEPLVTGDLCPLSFAMQVSSLFQKEKIFFFFSILCFLGSLAACRQQNIPNGVISGRRVSS
jgi:hypothetical protein